MTAKANKIIEILKLEPLHFEGGFFKETYRSDEFISNSNLPNRYKSGRAFSTAIYYLLTPTTFSTLHSLPTDEIFHFYLGDPVEMLQLYNDGTGKIISIGNDVENGYTPQVIVPKFTWQGSRLIDGGEFALLGTTMAPSFELEDFIAPDKQELIRTYPEFKNMIIKLIK
jgi:predicted cupin superfamily sugar epimerase